MTLRAKREALNAEAPLARGFLTSPGPGVIRHSSNGRRDDAAEVPDAASPYPGYARDEGSGERILQDHGVFAVRAGGDDADRAAGQFLQRAQVGAGGGRQVVPVGDAVGVLAPARELQVDRGDLLPALGVQRGVLGALAAVLVGDAHLQLLHAVEHVELGDAQAGDAVDGHRALEGDDVHPAAAARAAGGGAVLGAAVADALADLVVQLGRERAAADAGGVGLGDAQHVVDVLRAHAGAGQGTANGGVGAGDVRVGAVVDVQQRALGALEQHALALLAQVVADAGHVGLHRFDVLAELQRFLVGGLEVH